MVKHRGIAFKLILLCCASSAFIFLVIFGYTYRFSRDTIEKDTKERAISLAQNAVNRIETILRSVENVPEGVASVLENCTLTRREMVSLLRASVRDNPEIYGAILAFEPYALDGKTRYFAPYFYRHDGTIKATAPYTQAHFDWSWYRGPKQSEHPEWSEPYFDSGFGNTVMATYSVPLYRQNKGKKQFRGVVTADISLDQLSEIVSSIKILETGFGVLISKNGTIVTHPNRNLIMKETIAGLAEKAGDSRLQEVGRRMMAGESGFAPYPVLASGKPSWIYYAPIPSSNWSLAVVFPEEELARDLVALHEVVIVLASAGLVLLCLAVILSARSITRPLRAMAEATAEIAAGNLDIELPEVRTHDEVGKLTDSFRVMKTSLKEHIRQVAESAAERERISSELNIARDIQMNILPRTLPELAERDDFDLHAHIEPAREVGGDFYDFFPLDDNRLCFVIADVSGKGVPAALFMAMSMTLLKATARQGLSPDKVLARVNGELSRDNDVNMFVTVFCGVLDLSTGQVSFANAGHNHPLALQADETTWLKTVNGPALGIMEDFEYRLESFTLERGDSLFLYTDGVTEAMNPEEELFGNERLHDCLHTLREKTPRLVNEAVIENVRRFAADATQSDDITVMTIRYTGSWTENQ